MTPLHCTNRIPLLLVVVGLAGCTIQLVDQDPPDAVTDCGNGVLDPGEVCDDGNTVSGDGCSELCDSDELCGNGILDVVLGEECDTLGVDSPTCDNDCTLAACGDGYLNDLAGEVCDDGNNVSADGCRQDCASNETCANGIVDNHLPFNASVDQSCRTATVQGTGCAEACDDGNQVAGDGCSSNCLSDETCGNDVLDVGEECDDGNVDDTDGCHNDCTHGLGCGNGFVQPGEQCDQGPDETATCDQSVDRLDPQNCTFAVCGDNHRNPVAGEACDPGVVGGNVASCDADCTLPVCGDGRVNPQAGEQCDPGVVGMNVATCDNNCTAALCGDAFVNPAAGEQCDDGNNVNGDGCQNNCTLTP